MAPQKPRSLQPSAQIVPLKLSDRPRGLDVAKSRPTGFAIACKTCRKRKKKCDRRRPECSYCIERQLECNYLSVPSALNSAQRQRLADTANTPGRLAKVLSKLPYQDALELLDTIRSEPLSDAKPQFKSHSSPQPVNASASLALANVSISPSLSEHSLLGSFLYVTPDSVDFELMVRHPIAYPGYMQLPPEASSLGELLMTSMLQVSRPQKSQTTPETTSTDSPPIGNSLQSSMDYLENRDDNCSAPESDACMSRLPLSITNALDRVDVRHWTSLPISNDTAIRVMKLYFHNDYPVLPLFHAELFIRDLVQKNNYFCSPLLFSALLSWGCQAYTSLHPEAAQWSPAFLSEAQSIWAQFKGDQAHTLCNVAALQLMAMTAVTQGRDTLAYEYSTTSLKLGQAMGLFNVLPGSTSATTWLQGHSDWMKAASYTAWGVFNWASVFALHYHNADIQLPPTVPMPGDVEDVIASEHDTREPLHIDVEIFRAASKLWCIFLPVIRLYYGDTVSSRTIGFAEEVYSQLLDWADKLPLCLVRHPRSGHGVMMLHVYYHAIVTDVFRPFILLPVGQAQLQTLSARRGSAQAVYRASIEQMKRLLLLYRLQFRLARASVQWQTCLIYVANAAISATGHNLDELRFYLSLCLEGLKELSASYRVFGSITKGILGMAIRQGAISKDEVRRVRHELNHVGQRYFAVDQLDTTTIDAQWIIDLHLSLTDAVGAQGGNLAKQFEHMDVDDQTGGE